MKSIFYLVLGVASVFLVSCQSKESLVSSNDTGAPHDTIVENSGEYKTASIFWGAQDPYNADLKLIGSPSYALDSSKFDKTKLSFGGEIKSSPSTRDIVFVVDVSGSMGFPGAASPASDPQVGNSCGRLQAVIAAINSAKAQGPSRFAVITFSGSVVRKSPGFFQSLDEMFPGESLSSVLCAAGGGTNYTVSLDTATKMLSSSPRANLKEVYFLTDGEPSFIYSGNNSQVYCNYRDPVCNGVNEADYMHQNQINLATIMLGDNQLGNSFLRNSIAGTSPNGTLLHANVLGSHQLVESLFNLSLDPIVSGVLSYRHKDGNWIRLNMLEISQSGYFRSPSVDFDGQLYPLGLEVRFEYLTARGYTHTGGATVTWASSN